jgi:hypothetical protein
MHTLHERLLRWVNSVIAGTELRTGPVLSLIACATELKELSVYA